MYPNNYQQQFYQPYQPTQTNNQNVLIPIPNEQVARNYPVAYGASVSFKDENAPYIYTKTMGLSQLETPKFEKFRLIKEEAESPQEMASNINDDTFDLEGTKSLYEALKTDVDKLKKELFKIKKELKANDKDGSAEAAVLSEVSDE